MLELGVKTTLIVDSAARSVMKKADMVVVGADAITSEGNVVNKIGTGTIAVLAHEARVPFYVVSELLKFDPATLCGDYEGIEERNRNEVWEDAPKKLTVRNPAFEVTRRDYIHGLICEEGIIPPQLVAEVMQRKYPWISKPT
jgi:ribose 1,5-bisphosphate isomerase